MIFLSCVHTITAAAIYEYIEIDLDIVYVRPTQLSRFWQNTVYTCKETTERYRKNPNRGQPPHF
jgi:hypothetical protein